ncbi:MULTISPECIES: SDR family oxidoreductase [unclassified Wenzhouxiangella]|uniref:SDR family oxidoreductase n=1 Tax=unclassified Wenzhouxiangella TaxID=2613841 RepID=UPI000E3252F5|nr:MULTISPECIES: SDR family oxidoreductase [unclassified Wenzhouxiangella]RFF27573.1 NAD-dependent epimerase/dehydratase family protein [Wenzhouxiangella sp. 15181]RFP69673.1 NAD-dependent epimerase/dehydratase family protein [Wenzhouxiangella sp. 15190]
MSKRILITGAAGYIGHQLGNRLAHDFEVFGTDIRERDDLNFPLQVLDIRSRSLAEVMRVHAITHVVHLASVLQASRDRQRDFDIDVGGTRNVVQACIETGVKHLTVTSSGAAYGYHADNPEWIDEDDPLRGNETFAYADHKRRIEEMLARYRKLHPELKQLVLRPGTVLGADTRNQITALFTARRILVLKGHDSPFVFIWDEDVLEILEKGIREDAEGVYNLAGDGALDMREIARRLGKPTLALPVGLVKLGLRIARWLGKPTGPEQIDFLRYRPVLSNRRLKEAFGYTPKKTSAETFDYFAEHTIGKKAE